MFIRVVKKHNGPNGKVFFQFNLVQSVRINNKVRQRIILYLGSNPLLIDKLNRNIVLDFLKSKIFSQPSLFPINADPQVISLAQSLFDKFLVKYGKNFSSALSLPPSPDKAEFHNVDIKKLNVVDVKRFGTEFLLKQVVDKLNLSTILSSLGFSDDEVKKALISIVAKAAYASSEFNTARIINSDSELYELFGFKNNLSHKQLYSIADLLYKHKDEIDKSLYRKISNMFNIEDKLVIFDISNTYFETRKDESQIAKRGRSKEKRTDSPIVVFTAVINSEGFIRHSRVYEGNKPDVSTLSDMLRDLEKHSSPATSRTIVIDAGIASEKNLQEINDKGYKYVCVSRSKLKDYEIEPRENRKTVLTDRGNNKLELSIIRPEGYGDVWMYVRSQSKKTKEKSMEKKLRKRFEEDLEAIKRSVNKKGGTKKIDKVWRRIGRVQERHKLISSGYEITVEKDKDKVVSISWTIKSDKIKEDKSEGVYFIRTNYEAAEEKQLWNIYNTIRGVEATFRSLKSDLNIRPVYHRNDERIDAHIYLTMLAYQLVNTIRYMLGKNGISYSWTTIRQIMSTQRIQTVILRTDKKEIHLRKPSEPIAEVREIYRATQCKSTKPAEKKFVVYH